MRFSVKFCSDCFREILSHECAPSYSSIAAFNDIIHFLLTFLNAFSKFLYKLIASRAFPFFETHSFHNQDVILSSPVTFQFEITYETFLHFVKIRGNIFTETENQWNSSFNKTFKFLFWVYTRYSLSTFLFNYFYWLSQELTFVSFSWNAPNGKQFFDQKYVREDMDVGSVFQVD